MTKTTDNPWFDQHVAAETDYQDGDRSLGRTLVEMEYALGPDPIPCPHCPAETHWKATIGCMKCPSCGGLARSNGAAIGVPRQDSPQCEARNPNAGGRCQRASTTTVDGVPVCDVHGKRAAQ